MKHRNFRSYNAFEKFTGLITNEDHLNSLGLIPDDDAGWFDINRLQELKDFCKQNPKYHIITETSDCDEYDLDKYYVTTIDNEIRFVNRMHFFIGNGSKNSASLVEKHKRYEFGEI